MNKLVLFFTILFFCLSPVYSQPDTTAILEKIKTINAYLNTNIDSSRILINEAIAESKKIKFGKGTTRLYLALMQYYSLKALPDSTKLIIPELEKAASDANDISVKTSVLLKIALHFSETGDFKNAIKKAIEAQKITEGTDNYRLIAKVHHDLGFIYSNKQLYPNALTYFKKGLHYAYLSKDTFSIANMYARIGGVFNETTIPDSGLFYNTKSLYFFEKIKMKRGIGVCLNNIAGSYELMKNYQKAIEFYNKALNIRKELGDEYAITIITYNLGVCNFHMKNYGAAKYFLNESLSRNYNEQNYPQILESLKQLCEVASETNDLISYKKHAEKYIYLKDSITAAENLKSISELQEKYESEKKEKNILMLKQENEKKEEINKVEKKNKYTILVSSLIIVIILSVFAFFLYNRFQISQKQKRIIEMQKMEVEKQRDIIELKNKEIIDSINYAKRIQQTMMPTEYYIEKHLNR